MSSAIKSNGGEDGGRKRRSENEGGNAKSHEAAEELKKYDEGKYILGLPADFDEELVVLHATLDHFLNSKRLSFLDEVTPELHHLDSVNIPEDVLENLVLDHQVHDDGAEDAIVPNADNDDEKVVEELPDVQSLENPFFLDGDQEGGLGWELHVAFDEVEAHEL